MRRRFARWYLAGYYRRQRRKRDRARVLLKPIAHHRLFGPVGYVAVLRRWVGE